MRILGCIPKDVVLNVEQRVNRASMEVHYESKTAAGVHVKKRRRFVADASGGTRVEEVIDGM